MASLRTLSLHQNIWRHFSTLTTIYSILHNFIGYFHLVLFLFFFFWPHVFHLLSFRNCFRSVLSFSAENKLCSILSWKQTATKDLYDSIVQRIVLGCVNRRGNARYSIRWMALNDFSHIPNGVNLWRFRNRQFICLLNYFIVPIRFNMSIEILCRL